MNTFKESNIRVSLKKNYPVVIAALVFLAVMEIPLITGMLHENRWYRDMMNITPFHNEAVHTSKITDEGIELTGELVKRRCTFYDLIGYVTFEDQPKQRVEVIPESNKGSRPPSEDAEAWGPWLVAYVGKPVPDGWQIYVDHIKCPTPPKSQTNLFIKGEWENSDD